MMTSADKELLPEAQDAPSATDDEAATAVLKSKWTKIAICCGGVIVGIPFLTVIGLIIWVVVNHLLGKA